MNIFRKKEGKPVNAGSIKTSVSLKFFIPFGQILPFKDHICSLRSTDFYFLNKKAWGAHPSKNPEIFSHSYHIPKKLKEISSYRNRFHRVGFLTLFDPLP